MTTAATALPLLGLRITAGPVEFRLDAQFITSGAYTDNPASLAVSRKCGYADNGVMVRKRMDKPATVQLLILEPGNLVRYEHQLTVEGLPEFRRSIGLDA
jgi:hypothetical protein